MDIEKRVHGERLTAFRSPPSSLTDILRRLRSDVLRVVRAPTRKEVFVSEIVIYDPRDEEPLPSGAIVLCVGLSGEEGEAMRLIEAPGAERIAAVVFRGLDSLSRRLAESAEASDVAILSVPHEITWGHLYSLLRTSAANGASDASGEMTAVPLGDLFGLADAIARAARGAVTIEDPRWHVLAYSNLDYAIDEVRRQTILGREPPLVWRKRLRASKVEETLHDPSSVIRFEGSEGFAPRMGIPVLANGELLGSIWLAEGDTPLDDRAAEALREASGTVAIHLLYRNVSEEFKRENRNAYVAEVLAGRGHDVASGLSREGGGREELIVVGFKSAVADESEIRASRDRVLSVMSLLCEHVYPDARCGMVDGLFWALLPADPTREKQSVRELIGNVINEVAHSLDFRTSAVIGPAVREMDAVPWARHVTELALSDLDGTECCVIHSDDVKPRLMLLEVLEVVAEHPTLSDGKVKDILAFDRSRGTHYGESLRAYFDSNGEVAKAAACLGVHPNTLRYRLQRLRDVWGLNLEDPDERLVAELQLRTS